VLGLTRLAIIGVAATLPACIVEDTTTGLAGLGSGSGSGSDAGSCYAPTRLDLTLDRSTIPTELATANPIAVTLTASGGFGGTATLSATLRDPHGGVLPGWTIALDATSVYVPLNGTATVTATVHIPGENRGLLGTARVVVASSAQAGISAGEATLIALDQVTFPLAIANGQCVYPSPSPNTLVVKSGTKLRWLNKPTNTSNLVIHVDSNPYGVYHQPIDPGLAPGQLYEQTPIGPSGGTSFRWYCHSPGPVANNFIQPVD
jgi:hypothetical protein